jgi:hypothetical protein
MTPPRLAPRLQSLPPILHMLQPGPMSSCSKAPRGLFVLLRTDGIFTVNALSPSSSSRQYPYHYTIRAGQNLPDKEFRYLRTVIVTAAVHRGFSSSREALPLTFRHRAGVSPYTSTFVLAETCVFGKQLHGFLSCGPATLSTTIVNFELSFLLSILLVYTELLQEVKNLWQSTVVFLKRKLASHYVIDIVAGQALFRSYGRLFAEFLDEESLVHLGLLDLSTCVGLRYG